MVNYNDAPVDDLLTLVTQLFRSLSKPTVPISEPLQQAVPLLFVRYTEEYPTQSSYEVAQRVVTDMIAQIANQWPRYAEIFGLLLEGEPISALAHTAPMRWGWSESTFYNRYRAARECFVEHLQEAEKQARRQQTDNSAFPAESVQRAAPMAGEPPFKGLQFFDVADAPRFYGRETLVQELVQALQQDRFLAIVGASGSGKSSLARAGLVALLMGEPDLTVYLMTPTIDPLRSLAFHLMEGTRDITKLLTMRDGLLRDTRYLDYYLADLALQSGTRTERFLLVIDQFEELFTLCTDPAVRRAFVENVMTAFTNSRTVWVVFTLRADFYAHCAEYEELRTALSKFQHYIGPMNSAELRRAIEEPAYQGGWDFESALVELLLQDVGQEPAALPLLSHALLETWKRREGRLLTVRGYVDSGRVQGAIAQTADEIFQRTLLAEQRTIARNIFLRLTELGEGVPDTRRRVAIAELISTPAAESVVADVLQILTAARLVTTYQDEAEVAHEALIRQWPLLQRWLQEERDDLLIHRRMTEAAYDWIDSKRDGDLLYRGARLEQALDWARRYPHAVNAVEREYLTASEQAVVSARNQAELRVRVARAGQLAALSQVVAQDRAARASTLPLMLAKAAVETTWLADGEVVTAPFVTVEADAALQLALDHASPWLMTLPRHRHTERLISVAFSPNGQHLVTTSSDQTVRIWDVESGEMSSIFLEHKHSVQFASFSPDGKTIGSVDAEGYVYLWQWQTNDVLHRIYAHPGGISSLCFSPDGTMVLTTGDEPVARLWAVSTAKQLAEFHGHSDDIKAAAFSHDGNFVATASDDHTAVIWERDTGKIYCRLIGHTHSLYTVEFSKDDSLLLTASWDGTVRLWSCNGGIAQVTLNHPDPVLSACFCCNDQKVVTGCRDKLARLWDVETQTVEFTFAGHRERVRAVAYDPVFNRIVTAGNDSIFYFWDPNSGAQLRLPRWHIGQVTDVCFHPTKPLFATVSTDGEIKLWHTVTGQEMDHAPGHQGVINYVDVSSDGNWFITGGDDGSVRLWGIESLQLQSNLSMKLCLIQLCISSVDGQLIAFANQKGEIYVWDHLNNSCLKQSEHQGSVLALNFVLTQLHSVGTDNIIRILDLTDKKQSSFLLPTSAIRCAAFSPNGKLLAFSERDKAIRVWDTVLNKMVSLIHGFDSAITKLTIAPDNKTIYVGCDDGSTYGRHLESGVLLLSLLGHRQSIISIAVSSNGQTIATLSLDQTVRLWSTKSNAQARKMMHELPVTALAFDAAETKLAIGLANGTLLIYDIDTQTVVSILHGHLDYIYTIKFNTTGTRIISGSRDCTARIWDVEYGEGLHVFTAHTDWVKSVCFSPDDAFIATSSDDRTVRIWDSKTYSLVAEINKFFDTVGCVRFSADGRYLLTATNNKLIQLWSLARFELQKTFSGHQGIIWSVEFSSDSSMIVSASRDGTAKLWDVQTGSEIMHLQDHVDEIYWAGFLSNDKEVVTVSKDKSVGIWNVATGKRIRWLVGHDDQVLCGAFAPIRSLLVTGSLDKYLIFWDTHLEDLLSKANSQIQRDPAIFTRDERLRFGLDGE